MESNYYLMEANIKKMIERKLESLKQKYGSDSNYAESATNLVINKLLDEVILDTVAEYHRALKTGRLEYLIGTHFDDEETSPAERCPPYVEKKAEDIKCPNCTRTINASRFAPHLEKCMKMGRSSSRIASRRIANNSKETSYSETVSGEEDDDEEWNEFSEKTKISKKSQDPKRKKDKSRKQKSNQNLDLFTDSKEAYLPYADFILMSNEEKVKFLTSNCGVTIENNKKMCSRAINCTYHSDDERLALKKLYSFEGASQDSFVDIESFESQQLEFGNSCTSSPTDSASNCSSTSSRKKEKKHKHLKYFQQFE